jgi:hypothetical protein
MQTVFLWDTTVLIKETTSPNSPPSNQYNDRGECIIQHNAVNGIADNSQINWEPSLEIAVFHRHANSNRFYFRERYAKSTSSLNFDVDSQKKWCLNICRQLALWFTHRSCLSTQQAAFLIERAIASKATNNTAIITSTFDTIMKAPCSCIENIFEISLQPVP